MCCTIRLSVALGFAIVNCPFPLSHFFGFQRRRAERPSALTGVVQHLGAQTVRIAALPAGNSRPVRQKKFCIFRGDFVRGLAIPRAQKCWLARKGGRPAFGSQTGGGSPAKTHTDRPWEVFLHRFFTTVCYSGGGAVTLFTAALLPTDPFGATLPSDRTPSPLYSCHGSVPAAIASPAAFL